MNANINLNELTAKLNEMLARESSLYEGVRIPVTEEQKKYFSDGYAEGIADVLYMLEGLAKA